MLCRLIPSCQKETTEEENRYTEKQFLYNGKEEHKMSGIIRYLTNESGGNVHDKGVVIVKGSSEAASSRLAKIAVDLDAKDSQFRSKNLENSWLQYDFKNHKVHLTHYSIRSKDYGPGHLHHKHWVIEGSNTGDNDWKILDTRENISVLNAQSVTHVFDIQENLKSNEIL